MRREKINSKNLQLKNNFCSHSFTFLLTIANRDYDLIVKNWGGKEITRVSKGHALLAAEISISFSHHL